MAIPVPWVVYNLHAWHRCDYEQRVQKKDKTTKNTKVFTKSINLLFIAYFLNENLN